jgi:hypothetical protein
MSREDLEKILDDVKRGRLSTEEARRKIQTLPFEDLGFAKVDHHRAIRCGAPEVIFCQGKTTPEILKIAESIIKSGNDLLATRASAEVAQAIKGKFPKAKYNEKARTITLRQKKAARKKGLVTVVSAGTSDIPVAEEARVTAEFMGVRTKSLYDVGVAGIHRLLSNYEDLSRASVIVVVAGMEGALPSVVGGLVDKPVIAVPTSVGYGASFGGLTALLAMLNSCASGVSVVNIDNGFGGGYIAALIARLPGRSKG